MGRKKCMQCKEWIVEDIVCDVIGDKPAHFCSVACRDKAVEIQKQKEKDAADKDKVYKLICDIFGVTDIINTALFKEWQTWKKVKSDEIIAKYLEENKDELTRLIARLSSGEYAKIRYLSAILKNKLGDYKPKVEVKEIVRNVPITEEIYEVRKVKNNKRTSLADLEDEF